MNPSSVRRAEQEGSGHTLGADVKRAAGRTRGSGRTLGEDVNPAAGSDNNAVRVRPGGYYKPFDKGG